MCKVWILEFGDFGFWGFWILHFGDLGFWILEIFGTLCSRSLCAKFGFWNLGILDFGDFGFCILGILDFGFWRFLGHYVADLYVQSLDFGFWGFWILHFGDLGFWILEIFGVGILDWQVVTKFWMLHKKRRLCTPTGSADSNMHHIHMFGFGRIWPRIACSMLPKFFRPAWKWSWLLCCWFWFDNHGVSHIFQQWDTVFF